MAQITGHSSFHKVHVQYSTTGTGTWIALGGCISAVSLGGGERAVGEAYTSDGDTPLLAGGKRGPLDVTLRYVYAEGSTGANGFFEICRTAYETAGGGNLFVRWAPKGNSATTFLYTASTNTKGTHLVFPGYSVGEVQPGDPITQEAVFRCTRVVKSTVT